MHSFFLEVYDGGLTRGTQVRDLWSAAALCSIHCKATWPWSAGSCSQRSYTVCVSHALTHRREHILWTRTAWLLIEETLEENCSFSFFKAIIVLPISSHKENNTSVLVSTVTQFYEKNTERFWNSLSLTILKWYFLFSEKNWTYGQHLPSIAYFISWANMFHITSALIFPTFSSWGNLDHTYTLYFFFCDLKYFSLFCNILDALRRETHWLRQGVYEFLSSSIIDTMSVMSLDQKSRFLILGPCSSGGTVLDWVEVRRVN